jgi:ATP-dependent DNA helicase RecG
MTFDELLAGTYTSYARNRKIADLFREAGIIEKYGSGIKRITNAFVNCCLTAPTFEAFQNGFRVTVFANGIDIIDGGVNELFILIEKNPGINVLEMKEHFNVTQRTVERWVKKLKDDHKIEFRGASKKGGYWVIGS